MLRAQYKLKSGYNEIRHFLLKRENDSVIHAQLLAHLKNYMWLGGMPAVDFILVRNGEIIPVEVKSSQKGSMKSVQLFLESHPNSSVALKISEGQFAKQDRLIEIPLYALESFLNLTT